jgi:putative phosphoribosyl transferase
MRHRRGHVHFENRRDAGRRLAALLSEERDRLAPQGEELVVVALARGGAEVADAPARVLAAPFDLMMVRKLGVPAQPELAMGAIAEGGVTVREDRVVVGARVSEQDFERVVQRERAELASRVERFRAGHPQVPVDGRVAVIVDDGVATGATARAAAASVRTRGATRAILAVPVAPVGVASRLAELDDVVVVAEPPGFIAVGQYYDEFEPVADAVCVAVWESLAARSGGPRDGSI